MKEIWKDIEGYKGCYQVSNFGNIRSLDRIASGRFRKGKVIARTTHKKKKPSSKATQYERACLIKDGIQKNVAVHRLVAFAFLVKDEQRNMVNHKDGNGLNNHVSNLEWCTARENALHAWNDLGLSSHSQVRVIAAKKIRQLNKDGSVVAVWDSAVQASREAGFSASAVCQALKGKIATSGGYRWEYV